ncbi:MAG: hypothetical protein RSO15_15320 [Bacteroides sp.]|uniref:hypothetical protein n=1 Tax=Bacteroides sp. TaxID=29523 RepID=UPI002FCA5E0B
MKTIVFIALHLSQPRCIKRIATIKSAGIPIKVYGFDSGLYNDNLTNLPFPVTKIIKRDKNIGKVEKIFSFTKTIHRIINENPKDCIFYFFGFEITSIAWLLGCRSYIYEEADVTASRIKNKLIKEILLSYDRLLYRNSKLVVCTSEGFVRYLFKSGNIPSNIEMQLNKLSTFFTEEMRGIVNSNKTNEKCIKFAFVGLIRYPNTIIRFSKVIGKHFPQHEFHFYGDPEKTTYLDDEIQSYSNVFCHGRFKNPQDLKNIYEAIDINIVCYDTKSDNVRIAEPNKLYESIFFHTPIIVSTNTFLAEKVKRYNIGYEIDSADDKAICRFVKGIDIKEILQIKERMKSIPISELVDNPQELKRRIQSIVS